MHGTHRAPPGAAGQSGAVGHVGTAGAAGTAAGSSGSDLPDSLSGGLYIAGGSITINGH
jgi:hypothetical protein